MILETLSLLGKRTIAFPLVQKLSQELSSDTWMSTQTTAYCLMSMAEFIGKNESKNLAISYSVNGKPKKELSSTRSIIQIPLDFSVLKPSIQIRNQSEGILYARINRSGIPEIGDQTSKEENLKMDLFYSDMEGNPIDINKLKQGTDFKLEVRIKHTGVLDDYEQMALSQIFSFGLGNYKYQIWRNR